MVRKGETVIFSDARRPAAQQRFPNFWISYSDLMAGLLLVFVLLLIVAMFHYAESVRRKQVVLDAQEDKLVAFHELQQNLIHELEIALADEIVIIDPQTGVLQINAGILFGEDEASLRPEGRERLDHIFDAYFRVVLAPRFRDSIKQIEIEGHTNSNGPYLYNLELSQQRALAVMKALLAQAGPDREVLEQLVTAGGRSFSYLVRDEQGREDPIRSRRIEIKFRLKESEMFGDIYRELAD